MNKIFFSSILLIFLCSSTVLAAGPVSHQWVNDNVLADPSISTNPIGQTIINNRNYFDTCYMVTDSTIVKYLQPQYAATHGWSFQECVMNKAQGNPKYIACSYGTAAHEITDSVFHNNFVPSEIRKTKIPNIPGHILSEGAVDAYMLSNHPETYQRAKIAMTTYYNDVELQRILQECVNEQYNFNLKENVDQLNRALQDPSGFFTTMFKLPGFYEGLSNGDKLKSIICFSLALVLLTIIIFVKPEGRILGSLLFGLKVLFIPLIFLLGLLGYWFWDGVANMIDMTTANYWLNQAIMREKYIFTPDHWAERTMYEPTGYSQINQADSSIMGLWYVVGFVLLGLLVFAVYMRFKRR